MNCLQKYLLFFAMAFFPLMMCAQSTLTLEIEENIAKKNYSKAESILNQGLEKFAAKNLPDSIVAYIFYYGKISNLQYGMETATARIEKLLTKIKSLHPSASTLKQAYIEAGEYFGYAGNNLLGYKANLQAQKYAESVAGIKPSQLALIQNNLSTFMQRLGNLEQSETHTRKAISLLLSDPDPDFISLYTSYNGLGSMMYYASKYDSALHYFNLAIKTLSKAPKEPINQFFRPALLQNNLSGIYNLQGNTSKSIEALEFCIGSLKKFIASDNVSPKRSKAISLLFEATDNLGGVYKDLGDLQRASQLLQYSYSEKKKYLTRKDPGIYVSEILIGQLYYAMRENKLAQQWLTRGLEHMQSLEGDYLFWKADAYSTMALIAENEKRTADAANFYDKADSLYSTAFQGGFDNIYLEFLRNKAGFLADNGQANKAREIAKKIYAYILENEGKESLTAFYQLLNFSEIEFKAGDFNSAEKYAQQGLTVAAANLKNAQSLLDSIKMEVSKPKAILYKTRAQYHLLPHKTVSNIQPLLNELNEALNTVEKRRSYINDPDNNRIILAENKELIEFIKQLNMDLYKLTNDEQYIDQIMNVQESVLYTRIRNRLDKNDSIQFANIPNSVQQQEKILKAAIAKALKENLANGDALKDYFKVVQQFDNYKEGLKEKYPAYFKLRYASIVSSLGDVQLLIAPNTSLVKYFFIDEDLYVLVADRHKKTVKLLSHRDLQKHIDIVSGFSNDVQAVSNSLLALYKMLWMPIENDVQYNRVIVIPDDILYSLNIEILTPQKITSFKELASKSLLSKYSFSYQYSLFLLQQNREPPRHFRNTFVGFAPGFFQDIKVDYKKHIRDSLKLDNAYLTLLPQPFTLSLITKLKRFFGGKTYLSSDCTKQAFVNAAGNHQIIHVGTHAVSDNIFPEYSRLIFAKDDKGTDNNSLFADDIYNLNLNASLAVLTACESGRSGYHDGEGMISLAHAFNYAGSKSIVTSFWKIDEKSSAMLMEYFYKNLKSGMPKDEALRGAKLEYLQKTNGRMLAPAYWAGIVVLGDVQPLGIKANNNSMIIYISIALLLAGIVAAYAFSFSKKKNVFIKS